MTSVILIRMVIDAMEKRPFTNHLGGNSIFGLIFGISCSIKDIKNRVPLCKRC